MQNNEKYAHLLEESHQSHKLGISGQHHNCRGCHQLLWLLLGSCCCRLDRGGYRLRPWSRWRFGGIFHSRQRCNREKLLSIVYLSFLPNFSSLQQQSWRILGFYPRPLVQDFVDVIRNNRHLWQSYVKSMVKNQSNLLFEGHCCHLIHILLPNICQSIRNDIQLRLLWQILACYCRYIQFSLLFLLSKDF